MSDKNFVDANGNPVELHSEEDLQRDRDERMSARVQDLTRSKEEVKRDTERMVALMKPKQKRVFERLSKFVFQKHCKRTVYVAVVPNRAAQIEIAPNIRFDSDEYVVADVQNMLAAAALSSASVFVRYQRPGYIVDGLCGFIADRGRVAAVPSGRLHDAWTAYLKDGAFNCEDRVFYTQPAF